MSLGNYTLQFITPSPTAFLNAQSFGPMPQAVAINSLLYDTPRDGQKRPSFYSPSPNWPQFLNSKKIKDNRDPYRNQYGSKISNKKNPSPTNARKKSVTNYDEYFYEQDYDGEQNEDNYDNNFSDDQSDEKMSGEDASKVKRKFTTEQQSQESSRENPKPTEKFVPHLLPTYKQIANTFNSISEPGSKTSLHAVIDFDDDFEDYTYDDEEVETVPSSGQNTPKPQVTPIEGPIFIKNGTVPVVPLYSYPVVNNGTLIQIPILWTALSLALGFEIHGEIIRGVPCIKRFHQLFCPTAGNKYPTEKIEKFIEDNKALMKRMYGEFEISTEHGNIHSSFSEARFRYRKNVKRQTQNPGSDPPVNPHAKPDSYFGKRRSSRVDACESKIEIVTPYWASNSAGKIRAIVNTKHFEQAIHQEVCSKVQTKRCVGDCGCEQKYKWHRLLAYDPDNDCKGIFMDWFLFPSCCVCRCSPATGN